VRVAVIAGARPNFVKVAPLLRAARARGWEARLVHTGQHYDVAMSASFFEDLDIPEPDVNLEVGSGPHGEQTAKVMIGFEAWLAANPVDAVVVVGDVNSTVACALVAAKQLVPVAHVEAGLRSFDRTMPEEINRLLVDSLASWLLTPSPDADENLRHEGVHPARIVRVGNIMVDSLFYAVERSAGSDVVSRLGLASDYGLVTLHRPALVDDPARLAGIVDALAQISGDLPLVFPVHPRTRAGIAELPVEIPPSLLLCEPQGYLDFIRLESSAKLVLTDSGGVQEETTCLGIPCLTLRPTTERPITVTEGTNRVVGMEPLRVIAAARETIGRPVAPRRPDLWDGRTAERMIDALERPVPAEAWAPYSAWAEAALATGRLA
jgi:UDP-N-acetylglucosamine 2-epimerase (non-hydrolysing)